jgi:hypothetical protein
MTTERQLRNLVTAFPGTQEQQTWGHPTYRVRGRIFVGFDPDTGRAIVKAEPSTQHALVARDARTFSVAPRVGRFGWITVEISRVSTTELRELVIQAWRLTAPKRLVADFDRK